MPIFKKCKDPALKALKDTGFNVVQLPRPDLLPTQLLVAKSGRLRRLGELTSVFIQNENSAPIPKIRPEQPGPNISGTRSQDVKIGIGIDILSGLISALGGGTLGINAAYSKASSIQFTYGDTTRVDCDFVDIDAYIASCDINPHSRAIRDMLDADDVYVVTSVIKSKKIDVKAKSKDGTEFKVDVPTIENTIGGNVALTTAGDSSSVISYEGSLSLSFGFQALRLKFDGDTYETAKIVKAGDVIAESTSAPDYLDTEQMLEADF